MHKFAPEEAVLGLLFCDGDLVLARKCRKGKVNYGKRVGFGGGIKVGETPMEALIREVREEASVVVSPEDVEKVAHLVFHNLQKDGSEVICRVVTYLIRDWQGCVIAKDGMEDAIYYPYHSLPLSEMPIADPLWLPLVLARRTIFGEFWYGPGQKYMIRPAEIRDLHIVK